jgi:hypothetical protein
MAGTTPVPEPVHRGPSAPPGGPAALESANLALAFALELVALWAVARWGWGVGRSTATRVALAIGAAGLWAAVWGLLFSPRATVRLSAQVKEGGQWLMFAVAVLALQATVSRTAALVLVALVVVNRVLIRRWHQ